MGFGASLDPGEVERAHGVDILLLGVAVAHRGDIGDSEALDHLGVLKGKYHSGFATHGMAQDVGLASVCGDHFGEVVGQGGVTVIIRV